MYLLGTVACYWAPDINTLIIGRLLQGIGETCGVVMAIAMVKDLYADDHESAKVFTLVFSVMAVAPVIAPAIGSHLLAWFGWRSCFAFLLIYAVILIICTVALPEPYPVTKRRPLPVKRIVAEYALQLVYRPFLLIVLSAACAFSIMFAFIASSPYVYIDMVGLSAQWYGYCFGIAAAFIIVGNLTLNRLRLKMTDMRVIAFGMGIMLGGGMLLVILQMTVPHHVLSVLLPGVLIMFGTGILLPQLLAISMGHTRHFNGIASALIGTIRFGAGGVVTFFAAHWVGTTAVLVGVAVLILLVIMAVLTQLYCRT